MATGKGAPSRGLAYPEGGRKNVALPGEEYNGIGISRGKRAVRRVRVPLSGPHSPHGALPCYTGVRDSESERF